MERMIGDLTGLVGKIEQSAGQHAKSANEIYKGIALLNSIVQADSAMAEETASAGLELSQTASALNKELAFFRLDASGAGASEKGAKRDGDG
jgi:methyl-accepting chemotaxis protein